MARSTSPGPHHWTSQPARVAVFVGVTMAAWTLVLPAPRGGASRHCTPGAAHAAMRGAGVPERSPGSWGARLSGDGRYIAFVSYDKSLVAGDTNDKADVLRIDRTTGEVVRVSLDLNGRQFRDHASEPSISADGARVAFAAGPDVYVRDIPAGRTTRVSVNSAGVVADPWSGAPVLSPSGRFVGFTSRATNLVPLDRRPGSIEAYLRDVEQGTTERISIGLGGLWVSTWSWADGVSDDGRYVVFTAGAAGGSLTPGDVYPGADVFVRDRVAGTTEPISVIDGRSTGGWFLGMSSDGMRILFGAGPQPDAKPAVFIHDRASETTRVVAPMTVTWRRSAGKRPAPLAFVGQRRNPPAALSADGRFVALQTALPVGPDDINGSDDIVVIDLAHNTRRPASLSAAGCPGNGASGEPAFAGNGSFLAFTSEADDLAGPANQWLTNVYVRDLGAGRTDRIATAPR